jgi:hypothetical protein
MRPRVQRAPGLPCALFFWGANEFSKTRAHRVARARSHIQPSSLRTQGPIRRVLSFRQWSGRLLIQPTPGAMGPCVTGCVKTRASRARAELFSLFSSLNCQRQRFLFLLKIFEINFLRESRASEFSHSLVRWDDGFRLVSVAKRIKALQMACFLAFFV